MFFLRTNDRGPKLVLVQTLLRLKGFDVKISGNWDKKTFKAIDAYRSRLNLPVGGPVDGKVFFHLIQGTKLKLIDSIDASAGRAGENSEKDLRTAGEVPLLNNHIPGYGVSNAVNQIVGRSLNHRIALLRIMGHGNDGRWISVAIGDPYHTRMSGESGRKEYEETMKADERSYLTNSHYSMHERDLARLKPYFASFGYVEIHSCYIAEKQKPMLRRMADTFGVPVCGGEGLQDTGGFYPSFLLEGEIFTAYPNGFDLASWSARIESSIVMSTKIKQALPWLF